MASKNVETVRRAHDSWNRRDFDAMVRDMADNIVYTDEARNLTCNGKQPFIDWTKQWVKSFSDGRITNERFIDAGDSVIAEITVEGTNDGSFAGLPPTGRKMTLHYCEITRFDQNGRSIAGSGYYDLYTIFTQLGLTQRLTAAA